MTKTEGITKPVWRDALSHALVSDLSPHMTGAGAQFGHNLAVLMWWERGGTGGARFSNSIIAQIYGVNPRTITANAGILKRAGFLRVVKEVVNGKVQDNYYATLPDNHEELKKNFKAVRDRAMVEAPRSKFEPKSTVEENLEKVKAMQDKPKPKPKGTSQEASEKPQDTITGVEPVRAPEPSSCGSNDVPEILPPKQKKPKPERFPSKELEKVYRDYAEANYNKGNQPYEVPHFVVESTVGRLSKKDFRPDLLDEAPEVRAKVALEETIDFFGPPYTAPDDEQAQEEPEPAVDTLADW